MFAETSEKTRVFRRFSNFNQAILRFGPKSSYTPARRIKFHPILWIVTDKLHAWNDAKSKVSIEMESVHSSGLGLLDRLHSQENDDSHKSSRRYGLHR